MKKVATYLLMSLLGVCFTSCGSDEAIPQEITLEEYATANISNRNNYFTLEVSQGDNGVFTYTATRKSDGRTYRWVDSDKQTSTTRQIKYNDTDITLAPSSQRISGVYETDESVTLVVHHEYSPSPYVSSYIIYEATGITDAGIYNFAIVSDAETKVIESTRFFEANSLFYFNKVITDLKGNTKYEGDFRNVWSNALFLTDTIIIPNEDYFLYAENILKVEEVTASLPKYKKLWTLDMTQYLPQEKGWSASYEVMERTSEYTKLAITVKDNLKNTQARYTCKINPLTGELTSLIQL